MIARSWDDTARRLFAGDKEKLRRKNEKMPESQFP